MPAIALTTIKSWRYFNDPPQSLHKPRAWVYTLYTEVCTHECDWFRTVSARITTRPPRWRVTELTAEQAPTNQRRSATLGASALLSNCTELPREKTKFFIAQSLTNRTYLLNYLITFSGTNHNRGIHLYITYLRFPWERSNLASHHFKQ